MRIALGVVVALGIAACREVPQAPNVTPPPTGPFSLVHVDHVNPLSDCCGLIAEPALFAEGDGSLHLLYGAWDVGAVRYGGCATACGLLRSWRIGEVDSSFLGIGDGGQVAAALTPSGVHLLYQSATANGQTAFLSYGWCPGACYLKTSWTRALVDTMADVAAFSSGGASAAVDPAGVLHALYLATDGVRYAECPAACSNQAGWQRATLDSGFRPGTALAIGTDGRVHAFYTERYDSLRYATCAATCGDSANWQRATMSDKPNGWVSVAIGPDNHLHALYATTSDTSWRVGTMTYVTCAAACTTSANWQRVILDSVPGVGAIALGTDGSVHLALSRVTGRLDYARCDSGCLSPAAWRRVAVDSTATPVQGVALALGNTGTPTIAYVTWYDVHVAVMH